jgi:glutamate/tyrosine decarboxylase-like PLP-dependent enzyme
MVRHAADHRALKATRCAYAGADSGELRDGSTWAPENSRRARAFVLYAALRALGRDGVRALVERGVALAQLFAARAAALPHATILNEVVLNQVLIRFAPPGESDSDALHAALAAELQRDGTCWLGTTRWRGQAALRVSVSNWSTDEAAVEASVAALRRAVEKVLPG